MNDMDDKLVEMALKSGAVNHFVQGLPDRYAFSLSELTSFRAAIIADLCGDVEPVAWMGVSGVGERIVSKTQMYPFMTTPLYPAHTVAALAARVAELEKDAARLEFVCNSPNRMVERESGLWRVYEDVAPADHPTSVWQGITPRWHVTPREAIDAAITAALTKGQP